MNPPTGVRPEVLREYALLADGERGAIIGPHGDIVWMCMPRWDSDALFAALIGGPGAYVISPHDPWHVWGGYYEPGSLIWHSRWMTSQGAIECREALAFPGDPGRAVLLRQVRATDAHSETVDVRLDPRAGFGRSGLRDVERDGDTWTARSGSLRLRWTGAPTGAEHSREGIGGVLEVPAGRTHDLVLEVSDGPLPEDPVDPSAEWAATEHAWGRSVPDLPDVLGRHDARQACAVLRGLTSSHGGMVAAATTSLPERSAAGRNYDYRYAWIRDQSYAGQAAAVAGLWEVLDAAVGFIAARILRDGPDLRPAYTVDGGPLPEERHLRHVIGYPGGGDRAGNRVRDQFQLDVFGEALLLFAAAARVGRLGSNHWRAVEVAVEAIEQRRDDRGAGVWELHEDRWAHSRLICAAGLRAVAAYADPPEAATWTALADTIVADAARDSGHPSGRWQRTPTDPRVDAALLLPAVRGGVPAEDPRSRATLEAVRTELAQNGYVYRFRHDERPLAEAEGAFLLCGFLAALADHQQGNEVRARAWFERHRASCGPAGLFSEEYDVNQRQLRGNLPQAFVHALMLESACRLALPWSH